MSAVTDNASASRFELIEDGKLAFADYSVSGKVVSLLHVEVDPALRGMGAAGRLMEGILARICRDGMKVNPVCGYAGTYIRRSRSHSRLLA